MNKNYGILQNTEKLFDVNQVNNLLWQSLKEALSVEHSFLCTFLGNAKFLNKN